MPPSLNAGKVDLDNVVRIIGLPPGELALMKINALLELKGVVDPIAHVRSYSQNYNPSGISECVDCIVHFKLVKGAEDTVKMLLDCIQK